MALIETKDFTQREFPMTERNFEFLRKLARENTGIELSDHKKEMIYSRLVRRIRFLKLGSFDHYCDYLNTHTAAELTDFINAITTNLTSFFRENHHFEFLKATVFPQIRANNRISKRLRIWSAGCSTGEEPYSIAMSIMEGGFDTGWDAKILATDLDSNVVAHGSAGLYDKERVEGIGKERIQKWFTPSVDGQQYQVKPPLQQLISFKQLNLLQSWPMSGPFDVIFCRNVVIYFSKDTQKTLFDRYANMLADGGYLFIGHSESLYGVSDRFESLGRTIYRKIK